MYELVERHYDFCHYQRSQDMCQISGSYVFGSSLNTKHETEHTIANRFCLLGKLH